MIEFTEQDIRDTLLEGTITLDEAVSISKAIPPGIQQSRILDGADLETKYSLVWNWIKQDIINYKQFIYIIEHFFK